MSKMKVLITGATGYIGKKLAKELACKGYAVSAITRDKDKLNGLNFPISIINIDLVNSDLTNLELNGFDIIYNCAGELNNESLMHELHVVASMNLLKCISNSNTRWVQLSSVGVYGQDVTGIVDENTIFSPVGNYEITKSEAEIRVKEYCLDNNIPYSILRPSNVFSADMPNKSLRQLVKVIKGGFFFYMQDPTKVMANYVHVDDVVDALVLCGVNDSAVNNDYIVSDYLTQKEFVEIICDLFNREPPKIFIPIVLVKFLINILKYIPKFNKINSKIDALSTTVYYSTEKIENDLGYKKLRPLRQGIVEFSLQLD